MLEVLGTLDTKDIVQFLISIVALLVSIVTAGYAALVNRQLSSSDYVSSERVKSDTASLIATVRSIAIKAFDSAWKQKKSADTDREQQDTLDIVHEQQAINAFLNSSTAFAYWAWTAQKSEQAGEGNSEPWRLLFHRLSQLSNSRDPQECVRTAVGVERLFDNLEERDLELIKNNNASLVRAIANTRAGREGNPLLKAMYDYLAKEDKGRQRVAEAALEAMPSFTGVRGVRARIRVLGVRILLAIRLLSLRAPSILAGVKRDLDLKATVVEKCVAVAPLLDERSRRRWAAAESMAIGYFGDALVSSGHWTGSGDDSPGAPRDCARPDTKALAPALASRLSCFCAVFLETPRYQSIAADAAGLHKAGLTFKEIGARFSVDDHTAAKAVRWFWQR